MQNEIAPATQPIEIEVRAENPVPTADEIAVLGPVERIAFRLVRRMNRGRWKRVWTFCQRHIGSLWIFISTYNLMNVRGLENVD